MPALKNVPELYEHWDAERRQEYLMIRSIQTLEKMNGNLGWLVFFLVIIPLILGGCSLLF